MLTGSTSGSGSRFDRRAAAAALTVALMGVSAVAGCDKSKAGGDPSRPDGPAVHVVVSIDWEGAYFRSESLDALEQFRKENPHVPLTHFLNAAYYTKPQADLSEATREVRLAVKKGDETGLHIHAWKSLVAASGVTPKLEPSFLSRDNKLIPFEDDVGFDVDLSVYSVAELRSIMKKSRDIFDSEKIKLGPGFRAAGWLGTPNVLEAARAEGFTIDSSSTDPAWLDEKETPFLQERLKVLWARVDQTTQPFWVDTPAGKILEMPDSGALADYTQAPEIEKHIAQAAEAAKATGKSVIVVVGFHAETADDFSPRLGQALSTLRAKKVPMAFDTLSAAAEVARANLEGGGK